MATPFPKGVWVPNTDPATSSQHPYNIFLLPHSRPANPPTMSDGKHDNGSPGSKPGSSQASLHDVGLTPAQNSDENFTSPPSSPPLRGVFIQSMDKLNNGPNDSRLGSTIPSPTLTMATEDQYHYLEQDGAYVYPSAVRLFDTARAPVTYRHASIMENNIILPLRSMRDAIPLRLSDALPPRNQQPQQLLTMNPDRNHMRGYLRPEVPMAPTRALQQDHPLHTEERRPQHFRPMQTKLDQYQPPLAASSQQQSPSLFPPLQTDAFQRMIAGFSPNYKGNIHLSRNRSADIPANQNCSLFVVGLPPTATTTGLLATIRDIGRVYATHINAPEPHKGHQTCAAKIIFFERRAAQRFYDRFAISGLRLPGYPEYSARVLWNRIRTAEMDGQNLHTRVLVIAGPVGIVNAPFLDAYFRTKMDFEVDEVIDHGGVSQRRLVEFRFGSYRCQAESAKMAIVRELSEHDIQVWFGPDPCDGADGIAAVAESAVGNGVGRADVHPRFLDNWGE